MPQTVAPVPFVDQLRIPFEGSTYPERTVLVTTPFPFHKYIEGLSSVTYCWQKNGNFSLLQLPNQWRASLYFPEELSPEKALSEDRIQQQLHEIYPSVEPFTIYDKRVYRGASTYCSQIQSTAAFCWPATQRI